MSRHFKKAVSRRKRVGIDSVKEALDNLPNGVCFFYHNGIPALCNRKMHELAFVLIGRDLQNMTEIFDALDNPGTYGDVKTDGDAYFLPDGTIWRFTVEPITDLYGFEYIQTVASDITSLYNKKQELLHENERISNTFKELLRFSAGAGDEARERELLSLKIRVHDDIGACMLAARQILKQNKPLPEDSGLVEAWEKALKLLERSYDKPTESNNMAQLAEMSAGIGIDIVIEGEMPGNSEIAYLLITAMRECVTNAVRYAKASKLFVKLIHSEDTVTAELTNDGAPPDGEINEGCGLSTLRRRITLAHGNMTVVGKPKFKLTVTLPFENRGMK